jgi:hypothetical protein
MDVRIGDGKAAAFHDQLAACGRLWGIVLRRDGEMEGLERVARLVAVRNRITELVDEILATGMGEADPAVDDILLRKGLADGQRRAVQLQRTRWSAEKPGDTPVRQGCCRDPWRAASPG